MTLRFFLFLILSISLHAENDFPNAPLLTSIETEPSTIIDGCVNVISGSYFDYDTDLTVVGPELLTVQRILTDNNQDPLDGMNQDAPEWQLNLRGTLKLEHVHKNKTLCTYQGPLGEMLHFKYRPKTNPGGILPIQNSMLTKGQINTSRGKIGAQTNIRNTGLKLCLPSYDAELFKNNGDLLLFHAPFSINEDKTTLLLRTELKTNYLQKKFEYSHGNHGATCLVHLRNWNDKELSFIRKEPHDSTYVAPDGRYVRYHFEDYHIRDEGGFTRPQRKLTRVERTEKPHVWYGYSGGSAAIAKETPVYAGKETPQYMERDYYLEWPHVDHKYLPNHRFTHIEYQKSKGKDNARVKRLSAPLGSDITPIKKYDFCYSFSSDGSGCTGVYDALGHKTDYVYNSRERLTAVVKFHDTGAPYTIENLIWGAENTQQEIELQARTFGLANSPYKTYAKILYYDWPGNVFAEALHGNLTGKLEGNTITVDQRGLPVAGSADCLVKWNEYSQDKYHLLTKTTVGSRTIRHQYIPGSSILGATFTEENGKIYKRHYYFHDDTGMVIAQIVDDGLTEDCNDLTGVTMRKIERIERTTEYPFGLPSVVSEYYLDLDTHQEMLALRKINSHDNWGRLIREETYGNDGVLAYAKEFHYDLHSNLLHEITSEGHHIHCTYDENDNKISEVGPNPNISKNFVYDYMNRLIAIHEHHPEGVASKHFKYDVAGQLIAKTDAMGNETRITYDSFYRPIVTENNLTPPTRYEYDEMSNITKITDPEGAVTEFAYTLHKKPYKISYPDGSKERFIYDLEGRLLTEVAKNGTERRYIYDVEGRIIKKQQLAADGQELFCLHFTYNTFHLLSETDEAGNLTTYTYDYQGRKKTAQKGDIITFFEYDHLNACCKTTITSIQHPEEGTVKSVVFDVAKRPIYERTENLRGDILTEVKTSYDVDGNKVRIETDGSVVTSSFNTYGIPVEICDPMGNVTSTSMTRDHINDQGQRVVRLESQDPLGQITVQIQDILGRTAERIILNPLHQEIKKTVFTYNSNGKCIKSREIFPDKEVVNAWEYDYADRLICSIEALGTLEEKRISHIYNRLGSLESTIKPDGVAIHFTYDEMGRLKEQFSSDKTIHYVFHYDISSNPIRVDNLIDKTSTLRTYDIHKRVIKETLGNGLTLEIDYTAEGALRDITLPDQSSIHYTYNGPLLSAVIRKDVKGNTQYTHSYNTYDQSTNLLESSLINNLGKITQTFSKNGQLTSITSPNYSEQLTYDPIGNLTKCSIKDEISETYHYDDLYQLTQESGSSNHTYTYDALYNRTSKDGKLHQHNALNALLFDGESTYTYDASGNILNFTKESKNYTHTYDALDRLKTLTIDSATYSFTYDEHNRCLTINDDRLLYCGQDDIGTANHSGIYNLRVLGKTLGAEIGAAVAIEIKNEVFAPLHDHRGNLIALVNSNGATHEAYRYSAFGEELTDTTLSPWRFSSKRKVGDYNLFGRRFYLPFLGRWLTPDPIGHEAGPNLYAYVSNSPLTHLDHYGLFEEECNMSYFDRACNWGRSVADRICSFAERAYETVRDGFDYVCRGVQAIGAGIEFISENLIVVPVVRDLGSYIGHVLQTGTFTGYESTWYTNRSRVDDLHLPDLFDKVLFVFFNGMMNTFLDAMASNALISNQFDGTNALLGYNGTVGFVGDLCIESALNKLGITTSAVLSGLQAVRELIHRAGGPESGYTICLIAHSQGGIIADIVLNILTPEERGMICVATFGSARLIEPRDLKLCVNYVSKNDIVPMTDLSYIGARFFGTRSDVIFLDPIEGGFEHSFDCKTYQTALGRYAEIFKRKMVSK